jgi:hypothetical protein
MAGRPGRGDRLAIPVTATALAVPYWTGTLAEAAPNRDERTLIGTEPPLTWLALMNFLTKRVLAGQEQITVLSDVEPLNHRLGNGSRRRRRQFTGRCPQEGSHIVQDRLKPRLEARVE